MCSRTVLLDDRPLAISYWNNTVAVGLSFGDIIMLNVITGSQAGVLSGHHSSVRSVTFSSDGALLASGGDGHSIKLWDVQTGGIVKTFLSHTVCVLSVCISADSSMIASGESDRTIRIWNIQTGECTCVITQKSSVNHVTFLPMDSRYLESVSASYEVRQWDINGDFIGPESTGSHIAFSLDGTQRALCNGSSVTVQNTKSGITMAKFQVGSPSACHCCFSPDGRFIAASADSTAYVWEITSSDPHLIETFIGHSKSIEALVFSSSSSLISVSNDKSVKFWQIGSSSVDSAEANSKSATKNLARVMSTTLQATDSIAVTSDSDGVVRVWDILTGHCKESFQTPLQGPYLGDAQLIDGRIIIVWYGGGMIHIWDALRQEKLSQVNGPQSFTLCVKISGDGSKVFCLTPQSIEVWSIWTGQEIGKVAIISSDFIRSLTVEGPRVWAHYLQSEWVGWDFEVPDSPVKLSRNPPSKLHPNGIICGTWVYPGYRIQLAERCYFS